MPNSSKQRIAILGGGISGCIVAGHIAKSNEYEVVLFETNSTLGGLHRSKTIEGFTFDIGPFLFGERHALFEVFPFARDQMMTVKSRFQSLTCQGSIDSYPMSIRGYFRNHGVLHCILDCLSILGGKVRYRSRKTLPAYIKYYLGSRLYEESGLRSYIERLYGLRDEDVSIEFAKKRLKLIEDWASIRKLFRGMLSRKKTILNSSPLTPNDLVRPPEGFHFLYDQIGESLLERGVTLNLGSSVQSIGHTDNKFELKVNNKTLSVDHVVSTIPMETLGRLMGMGEESIPQLDYIPLFSLFYRFKGELGFPGNLLHNFTKRGMWKRITMFSAMYGQEQGWDYFVAEGTIHGNSSTDLDELQHDFEQHIRDNGLLTGKLELLSRMITSHAYPVYDEGNLSRAEMFKQTISESGIKLTGRQGEYDYISSADAAKGALRLAKQLTN